MQWQLHTANGVTTRCKSVRTQLSNRRTITVSIIRPVKRQRAPGTHTYSEHSAPRSNVHRGQQEPEQVDGIDPYQVAIMRLQELLVDVRYVVQRPLFWMQHDVTRHVNYVSTDMTFRTGL